MPEGPLGVLITRPEPGASDTAARVAVLGFRPVVAPLLAIHRLPANLPPPERVQAILVASGNAVAALPATHHGVLVLAVGAATAARACAAGFGRVLSADGDAEALGELAAAECTTAGPPLLLAAGRGQGGDLLANLRNRGFRAMRRVVYAAVPVSSLPPAAQHALSSGVLGAAMFFSAETARHGVRLVQRTPLQDQVRSVDALAIGRTAAVALEALPWRRISVAVRPTLDAMLALLR